MSRTPKPLHPVDQINLLREQICELQEEYAQLKANTRNREEVIEHIDYMVRRWESSGQALIEREFGKSVLGEFSTPLTVKAGVPLQAAPSFTHVSIDFGPILVAILGGEAVRNALAGFTGNIANGPNSCTRINRMFAIQQKLDALETEEERLIVSLNGDVDRRPNARTEIVLGTPLPVWVP